MWHGRFFRLKNSYFHLARIPAAVVVPRAHEDVGNDLLPAGALEHLLALCIAHDGHRHLEYRGRHWITCNFVLPSGNLRIGEYLGVVLPRSVVPNRLQCPFRLEWECWCTLYSKFELCIYCLPRSSILKMLLHNFTCKVADVEELPLEFTEFETLMWKVRCKRMLRVHNFWECTNEITAACTSVQLWIF